MNQGISDVTAVSSKGQIVLPKKFGIVCGFQRGQN